MATAKNAIQRLFDGLWSLLPCRRRRTAASKGPRVVVFRRPRTAGHGTAAEATTTDPPAAAAPATIRLATFNAAMFSIAPAVPPAAARDNDSSRGLQAARAGSGRRRPKKGILKAQQSRASSPPNNKPLRVSINLLQDDEIAAERSRPHLAANGGAGGAAWKGKAAVVEGCSSRSESRFPPEWRKSSSGRARSVAEVLREVGADIIGLQNVRAEQERGLRPLSELAEALGMRYVFAESWAPEYGNAVLSRWPIKRWRAHRIADQSDFRNVLRVTVDVPGAGEVNFHCTHLDHLDERLRMKQVTSILRSADGHHILAGGLNALDSTDYSANSWATIIKYFGEIGKPTPKAEVMSYLKAAKRYVDAKDFAAECEAVVVVAKGQDVQGTCKHGTRVDYVLASPNSPYKFVPGSYAVVSSKGTSDHHIVKADITIDSAGAGLFQCRRRRRVVRMSNGATTKGIWAAT